MEMLQKIIDGKSLVVFQENVYEGVFSVKLQAYSVKTATLLLRYIITDTFWNMYRKVTVLKNNILRKKSTVNRLLNKVATM